MLEHFQDYLANVKPALDQAYERWIGNLSEVIAFNEKAGLWAALQGGKKIRGSLLCLVAEAVGGALHAALPRAAAIEFIQTATLIHDDFVDQDTLRRNRPAVWTLEGARRAVLLGDVIFASAIKMMSDLSREDGRVISDAIAQVARGALHEPLEPLELAEQIESGQLEGSLYEKIIHLKTGILFGAACRLGAVAAQAPLHIRESLQRYGWRIGEAYQMADDLQEIHHHLAGGRIDLPQLIPLAPTCLHFAPDSKSFLLQALRSGPCGITGDFQVFFQQAAQRMQQDVEQRLSLAVEEIKDDLPQNEYSELVRRTPWDLIGMFNAHSAKDVGG
jgi:geranylgeranyl pyrophosphate synthase